MRKFWLLSSIAVVFFTASSCKKTPVVIPEEEKPLTAEYPSASFTLSALEKRATEVEFPWTISPSGETDSVKEKIDEMYVTSANTVTLSVKGGEGYNGVNVVSTNPKAVGVVYLGKEQSTGADTYSLVYAGEGESKIEVWNGSGAKTQKTTFAVHATKLIMPEAAVFVMDEGTDNEQMVRAKRWIPNDEYDDWVGFYYANTYRDHGTVTEMTPYDCEIVLTQSEYNLDLEGYLPTTENYLAGKPFDIMPPKIIHSIRFLTIEPENTSYRYVSFQTIILPKYLPKAWSDYLKENGYEQNWMLGGSGEISTFEKNFYFGAFRCCGKIISLGELTLYAPVPTGGPTPQNTSIHLGISDYEYFYGAGV